jgi:hypothetical protein
MREGMTWKDHFLEWAWCVGFGIALAAVMAVAVFA